MHREYKQQFMVDRSEQNECAWFDMLNDDNFALILDNWLGVLWVHMVAKWRIEDFVVTAILEICITTIFTKFYLPAEQWGVR